MTASVPNSAYDNDETAWYMRRCYRALAYHLDSLCEYGDLHLETLHERICSDKEKQLQHLSKRDQVMQALLRKQTESVATPKTERDWAHVEEIFAMVLYLWEPLFILDMHPDGKAYFQMYYPITQTDVDRQEPVHRVLISARPQEKLLEHIAGLLARQVIPLILGLDVTKRHFVAIRLEPQRYADWGSTTGVNKMRQRLDVALRRMELPKVSQRVFCFAPHVIQRALRDRSSALEYPPSSSPSSASAAAVTPLVDEPDVDMDETDSDFQTPSPLHQLYKIWLRQLSGLTDTKPCASKANQHMAAVNNSCARRWINSLAHNDASLRALGRENDTQTYLQHLQQTPKSQRAAAVALSRTPPRSSTTARCRAWARAHQ